MTSYLLPGLLITGVIGAALLLSPSSEASTESHAPCGVRGERATPEERHELLLAWVARGYPAPEAARAVAAESGWYPHALNCNSRGYGVAGGLMQLTQRTLHAVGFAGTPSDFSELDATGQQPYLAILIASYGLWKVPGDARLALAAPSYLRAGNNTIVYPVGSPAWTANPTLRDGQEGPITAGSIRRTVIA